MASIRWYAGNPTSFEEAYPTISDVKVEVGYEYIYGYQGKRLFTKNDLTEAMFCLNSKCRNGGLPLDEILHRMVFQSQSDCEEKIHCKGFEGTPKGRRIYTCCTYSFNVKIHIDYK